MEKSEIAQLEQFHLFPQCFPEASFFSVLKLAIQRNPLISNDHLSDEKLLLSDHCYYMHFHFRHVNSKKSALN